MTAQIFDVHQDFSIPQVQENDDNDNHANMISLGCERGPETQQDFSSLINFANTLHDQILLAIARQIEPCTEYIFKVQREAQLGHPSGMLCQFVYITLKYVQMYTQKNSATNI